MHQIKFDTLAEITFSNLQIKMDQIQNVEPYPFRGHPQAHEPQVLVQQLSLDRSMVSNWCTRFRVSKLS